MKYILLINVLTVILKTVSSKKDISQDNTSQWKNYLKEIKIKRHIKKPNLQCITNLQCIIIYSVVLLHYQYYNNSVATFNNILESGDIELNPGPGFNKQLRKKQNAIIKKTINKQASTPKCPICNIGVGNNRKCLLCTWSLELTHVICSN